mgnify:CR=1 FL=1
MLAVVAWVLAGFAAAWHLAHPGRSHAEPRLGREAGFEDVTLQTSDGVRIEGWYARPDAEPVGTLLVLHEREGHRSAERLLFAVEQGWAALALDLRGCGDSQDAVTGFGWHERLDVEAALAWIERRQGLAEVDAPVVGWGRSLGAAALVYAEALRGASVQPDGKLVMAPGFQPHRVDGLVLESLYRDIDTAFANRVQQNVPLPAGLARVLLEPVPRAAEIVAGVTRRELRPVDLLPFLEDVPMALAGGARDPLCTPAELDDLAGAAQHADVVRLDAGHEDFLRFEAWREAVVRFLGAATTR